ncbi:MAG: hypothetical protein GC185_07630 [Alphaproteobacteria bacterium]|nr:hypothetical protein [Alphaproteobacteria bacterium]
MENSPLHTSRDTGTGALSLLPGSGGPGFYRLFGTGGDCMFLYAIHHPETGDFETGAGHLADAATLVRDCVIASSNAGRHVDFAGGVKIIRNRLDQGEPP